MEVALREAAPRLATMPAGVVEGIVAKEAAGTTP